MALPVPERVRSALVDDTGPFRPFLELVRAIEAGSVYDIRGAADTLLMGPQEINRSVLRALSGAAQLE
jgi:EAL and modified HD-GYP domain-containing signal transduction protein